EEAYGGRQNVAVVTAGFAARFLGEPAGAVGKTMTVDGLPYEIIGVLGEDARFSEPVDVLVPWDEDELRSKSHTYEWYTVIGRLEPGVTVAQAQSELDGITAQLAAEYAELEGWHGAVTSLSEEATAEIRPALLVLLGSALCVLLIACANVANLLLARGSRREQELALRAALGASRRRLVSQLVVESLLLAVAGGTVGLLVGVNCQSVLMRLLPEWVPNAAEAGGFFELGGMPAAAVLVFTGVVALVSGVLFGLVPALKLSMARLTNVIAHSARGLTSPHRTQSLLVVAEVAAAAVLLVGTALLLQTTWNLARINPGFTPDGMLTARIELPTDTKYQT
ncbi:MAG: hypothetical protein GY851_16395, partial [bacterium]|nr:hypothetical protein [bacterium]